MIQPKSARTGELARRAARRSGAELAVVVAYGKILPRAGARRAAARLHQRPRVAAAEVSRRGAGPVGGDRRRAPRPASRSCSSTRAWTPGRCCSSAASRSIPSETAGELLARLAPIGAAALLEAIAAIAAGTARAAPQDHARATHAPMLDEGRRRDRLRAAGGARSPRGSAASIRGRARRRCCAARSSSCSARAPSDGRGQRRAGHRARDRRARRCTSRAATAPSSIRELQAPGRKRMAAAQFAAGRGIAVGDVLARAGAAR